MSTDLDKLKEDLKKLQEENQNLAEWKKLKEQLRQKYENKTDAFAALKKEDSESLSKSNFESFSGANLDVIFTQAQSETLSKELFFKMWDSWESNLEENKHKLQIIEQKLSFQQQSPEKKKEQSNPSTSLDELTTKLDTVVEKQQKKTEKKEVVSPNEDCFNDLLSQKKEPKPEIELKIKDFAQKEQELEYEEVSEYTDDDSADPSTSKPEEGEKKEGEGEGDKKEGEGDKKEGESEKKEGKSQPQGEKKKKKKKKVKKVKQKPESKPEGTDKKNPSSQKKSFLVTSSNMGFIQKSSPMQIIGGSQTTKKSFIPEQQQSMIQTSPQKGRTSYNLYESVHQQEEQQQSSSIQQQYGSGRGRLLRDSIGNYVSDIFLSSKVSPQSQIKRSKKMINNTYLKGDMGYQKQQYLQQPDRSYNSPGFFQSQKFGNQDVIKKVSNIRQDLFGQQSSDPLSNFQSPNSRKSSVSGRFSVTTGKSTLNLELLRQEKEELAKLKESANANPEEKNDEKKEEKTDTQKSDQKQDEVKQESKDGEEKKEEDSKKE